MTHRPEGSGRFGLLLVLTALLLAGCQPTYQFHGSPYPQPQSAPDLNLTTTNGQPFNLAAYAGRPVLLFFGYTHCPDVCPATTAEVSQVLDELGPQADQVVFAFITVDPDRDSAAAVRSFLDRFDQRFLGLTGDSAALAQARQAYGVFAERDSDDPANYTMTHTSRLFLIDPQGRLVTNYTFDEPAEVLLADLRHLLQES
jgi:protein SCO1/2